MTTQSVETVIVGGGITGLACAHALRAAGRNVRLLEASDRVGGVMRTTARDGFLLEHGPFNVLVKSDEFADLLDDLGPEASPIAVSDTARHNRYLYNDGDLLRLPTTPRAIFSSRLLTYRGKARLVRGLFNSAPGQPDASVDAIIRRRFGDEAADRIASAMTIGIWGAESDELEAASAMPALARLDARRCPLLAMLQARRRKRASGTVSNHTPRRMISFPAGLGGLCEAIASRLGQDVETATAATRIERQDDRWIVRATHHGRTHSYTARHVVLACGASTASTMLAYDAATLADALNQLRHVSLAVMNIALPRRAVDHPLDGYGFLVPRTSRRTPVLGVLWASSAFPHHAPDDGVLLRVFFGGTRHPEQMHWSDESLQDAAMDVLRPVLGVRSEPIFTDVHRWPNAVPLYQPGHSAWTQHIRTLAAALPGLHPAGAYLDGVSVNDCITRGVRTAQPIIADQPIDANAQTRAQEILA